MKKSVAIGLVVLALIAGVLLDRLFEQRSSGGEELSKLVGLWCSKTKPADEMFICPDGTTYRLGYGFLVEGNCHITVSGNVLHLEEWDDGSRPYRASTSFTVVPGGLHFDQPLFGSTDYEDLQRHLERDTIRTKSP